MDLHHRLHSHKLLPDNLLQLCVEHACLHGRDVEAHDHDFIEMVSVTKGKAQHHMYNWLVMVFSRIQL